MTPREQEILALVRSDPLISQADIAARLGISRSAVAGHIMNLTGKGIIKGRGYVLASDPFVALVGGANMDICASPASRMRMHDSNPGSVVTSPGGVARNIAENLARLGVDCRLVAAVGADHYGDVLMQQGRAAGIDMDAVLRFGDAQTSTYVSLLDESGDMHVAVNDMLIVDKLQPDQLRTHEQMLRQASLVVLDTNLPDASIAYLCETLHDRPLFVDAVSVAKAHRIGPHLESVHTLKAGRTEAEALCGMRCRTEKQLAKAARKFHRLGTRRVFISLGEKGLFYSDGDEAGIEPVPGARPDVTNANGAGDALFAGIAYGWLNEWPLMKTIRFAMSAAGLAMSHRSTINPDMSHTSVEKHLAAVYD
jgi:pseudouridine kinase